VTLAEAQRRLQLWLDAEEAVASAQSYTIGPRSLTRANLAEIRQMVAKYQAIVEGLASGRGAGVRIMRVMPRDL
jgi:hypothetical protein